MKVFLLPPPELPVPAVQGGAVQTLLTHLLEENARQGRLELVCASIPDDQAARQRCPHSRVLYLKRPPNDWRMYAKRFLRRLAGIPYPIDTWYFAAEQAVREEQPDLVIAEGGNLYECAAISRRIGRERCLLHLHAEAEGSPKLDELYGGALILSEYVRQSYLRTSGLAPERALLLPNCIDTDRFAPLPLEQRAAMRKRLGYTDKDFVVLFCGRIAREKGIHKLVEAFLRLDDPECRLMVVGSPFFGAQATDPFMEELQQKAAALGERITFTGFIHNDLLPQYYAAADLACFPALWQEPAGLVAIEAMACGLPVLATRSGGMTEYLAGSGAVLLEQDEELPVRLAEAILALKADPVRRREMRQQGLRAARRYTRQTYYDQFAALLEHYTKEN